MSVRHGPSYRGPAGAIREFHVDVPLDWSAPDGAAISVFFREIVDPERTRDDLPLLVFLQGGPGGKSPRPGAGDPPWLAEALKTFRVVLLDQRGTGRSTPVTGNRMAAMSASDGADYLSCFGTDAIIRDCEHIRRAVYDGATWSTLGQSYGGFLTLHYLSTCPEALDRCLVTGGLPGLTATADDVYRHTYPRVDGKNRRFARRYPHVIETTGRIADLIERHAPLLPDGDTLTVRRFQTLGLDFGMAPGFENVLWMMDEAFDPDAASGLSDTFLHQVMQATSFASNPLFVALQESIYGQNGAVTGWAAERIRAEHPAFDPSARPLLFTGEMMFPWMFEEIRALRGFRGAVDLLAERPFERRLYDLKVLADNAVPVAAIVYHDDMYVDADLSLETAAMVGNCACWVTNEYEHDGVRKTPAVFRRLLEMARGMPI